MAPALRLFITLSLLVLLLPGAAAPVQAAPALVSLDGSGRLNLTSRLQLVRAEGRDLQTILALDDSVWRRLDHPLSQAKGRYWARVAVQNATDMPLEQLIVSDFPATNSIALWQVDAAGNTRQLAAPAGINFPFLHRDERHRRVLATLQLAPGEQALLVWQIESRPLFRFAARVWPPEQFQPADHNRSLLYGMLYGALLIMAVYNLFLWIALREKHYFFYVIYLLCAGYLAGAEEGHLYQFLWPASAWPKALVLTLVSAASIGAFFVFSSAFLRLRRRQQTLFRFLRVVALLTIGATLIGGILEQAWAARTALALAIPFYLLALLAAVRVRMRGFIPAGYYVAAMLLLVIAMVLNNLVALGVWSGISGLEDFNAIATAVMMAFFSIALASKIDQLQRDSDNAAAGIASANREIHRINNELVQARMERAALEQSAIGARRESQAKSAFLATIGHEIRTPMSGVL
ncbi:MAG: 7TM diverse intracellular signaling domain-containing protein, partial [Spongiibacteraceae bacterium]|nr:7TM diverse intracellular signaling domain-containing protein [Spongiibacteraceae bacterium]